MAPFESTAHDNAPPVTLDDVEAEGQAQEARDRGTEMVREHLRQHLRQNPNSSYVTWIATLHPENASVVIDPRFLTPENPWWTVYEETKVYEDPTSRTASKSTTDAHHPTYAGFFDLTIGLLLAVAGAASAFLVELCALFVHAIAYGFKRLTLLCCRQTWSKFMFAWIWFIVWKTMALTEWLLLLVSVLVTEVLAGFSYILCSFLSCSHKIGRAAHQRTRRLSHLVRWACRKPFSSSFEVQVDAPNVHEVDPEEYRQGSSINVVVPTATLIGTVSPMTTTTTTSANHPVPTAPVVTIDDVPPSKMIH